MIVLAYFQLKIAFIIMYLFALMTDILDGLFAKKLKKVSKFGAKFDAIADDLNMPQALAAMWGVLKDQSLSSQEKYATLSGMDRVLGFGFEKMQAREVDIDDNIRTLVEKREQARNQKDFEVADKIRDELLILGVIVEDTPEGPRIKWKEH